MIHVLLIDDHTSFRQPLAFMLNREPDITVIGQAGSLSEARERLQGADVAVIDLNLGDGSGVDLVKEFRDANPRGKALVLTGSMDQMELAFAVEAGAAGILNKTARLEEIVAGVRKIHEGGHLFSVTEMVSMMRVATRQREESREAQLSLSKLTPREREVLQALSQGLNDKEIAQQLVVSTETVRTHMVNILSKLGVNSRLQALVFAIRHGLVEIS